MYKNKKTTVTLLFSVAASKLCNGQPEDLRNTNELGPFKRLLKTHVFNSAYNCDI